jgi:MFS transporter, ACS family, tartrate transporter
MDATLEAKTVRKVFWHLLPFCMLLYIIAAIDRTNISFAALQMNKELGLSATVFGFGAGLFFLSYAAFEIPSNLILARVGARRWIARIMITWGIVVVAMAWTTGEYSFYAFRFLLGMAEAGFLPGLIYYFNNWIPRHARANTFAVFLCGTVASNVIAGPLSGWLLSLNGLMGWSGWQIMFVFEGIPAVILGCITVVYLPDTPERAGWLSAPEKAVLLESLQQEPFDGETRSTQFRDVLRSADVWKLVGFCVFMQIANYGVLFWMPQIIRSFGQLSVIQIGFLSAGPYVFAAICMVLWGRHSDATGERRYHMSASVFLAAIGLAASALFGNPLLAFAGLCLAATGVSGTFGIFWALPGDYLKDSAAAGGLAFINSVGIMGGFVGPYVFGFVRDHSSGFTPPLLTLAASAVVAALIGLTMRASSASVRRSTLPGGDAALTERGRA